MGKLFWATPLRQVIWNVLHFECGKVSTYRLQMDLAIRDFRESFNTDLRLFSYFFFIFIQEILAENLGLHELNWQNCQINAFDFIHVIHEIHPKLPNLINRCECCWWLFYLFASIVTSVVVTFLCDTSLTALNGQVSGNRVLLWCECVCICAMSMDFNQSNTRILITNYTFLNPSSTSVLNT